MMHPDRPQTAELVRHTHTIRHLKGGETEREEKEKEPHILEKFWGHEMAAH